MENVKGSAQAGSCDNGVSSCYVFKSRLQEYAQKAGISTPVYDTVKEGASHEPIFRSSVIVNNIKYDSLPGFFNRKAAEQSAAEVALLELRKSGNMSECIPHPVHETGLCKNLLQEYAQKMNLPIPSYVCVWDGLPGESLFKCTAEVGGIQYIGAAARTKKEAEIKVARTALLAIQSSSGETVTSPNSASPYTVLPGKRKGKESSTETSKSLKAKKPNNFKKRPPRRRFPPKGPKFNGNEQGIVDAEGTPSIQAECPGASMMVENTDRQHVMPLAMGGEASMSQQSFPVSDQFTSQVCPTDADGAAVYDQVASPVGVTTGGVAVGIESGTGHQSCPGSDQFTSQMGTVEAHGAAIYDQVGRPVGVSIGGDAVGIESGTGQQSFPVLNQFAGQVGPVETHGSEVYDQVTIGGDAMGIETGMGQQSFLVSCQLTNQVGSEEARGATVYDQVARQSDTTVGGAAQNGAHFHETVERGAVKEEFKLEGSVYDQIARKLGVTIGGVAQILETVGRGGVKQEFHPEVPSDGKQPAVAGQMEPGVGTSCFKEEDPVQGNGTTGSGHEAPNGNGEWHAESIPQLLPGNQQ